jgi:hypothetical protein
MEVGMQTFRAELLSKLYFVRRIHIAESGDMLSSGNGEPLDYSHLWYGPQTGNAWVQRGNPDRV